MAAIDQHSDAAQEPTEPDTDIEWDRDTIAAAVDEMRAEAATWRITWHNGTTRTTTLVGMAWYARTFDPDATVTPLEEN